MLKAEDRIFTNLYGEQPWNLDADGEFLGYGGGGDGEREGAGAAGEEGADHL